MEKRARSILRAGIAFAVLCAVAMAYLVGAYSYKNDLWPIKELHNAKLSAFHPAGRPAFDHYGRLVSYPGKDEIACPAQSETSAVLLIIGQSNAANSAGQRNTSAGGDRAVNFFGGKCFVAASPLLGATGFGGESWTLLANKLLAAGLADRVILIPAAIGATPIGRWQEGGDLNRMLLAVIGEANSRYRITHVVWHQGESDFIAQTSKDEYRRMFASLADSMRREGVAAPIFPSVATKCGVDPGWTPGNPVAMAQGSLLSRERKILPGVNTDAILGPADRYDDCHFSGTGQEKFANALVEVLMKRD